MRKFRNTETNLFLYFNFYSIYRNELGRRKKNQIEKVIRDLTPKIAALNKSSNNPKKIKGDKNKEKDLRE